MNQRIKNPYLSRILLHLKEDAWFGADFVIAFFSIFIKSSISYLAYRVIFLNSVKVVANEIALYYVLVNIISLSISSAQSVAYLHMQDINSGSIISDLVRPYNYPLYYYLVFLSSVLIRLTINFVLIWGISALLGQCIAFPRMVVGLFSTVLGFTILYLLQAVIGSAAVWFHDITRFRDIVYTLLMILGGRLLPSDLLFSWLKVVVFYTPMPYVYDIPVKAFMGKAGAMGIGLQFLWVLLLGSLYVFLFERFVKHNIEFGG